MPHHSLTLYIETAACERPHLLRGQVLATICEDSVVALVSYLRTHQLDLPTRPSTAGESVSGNGTAYREPRAGRNLLPELTLSGCEDGRGGREHGPHLGRDQGDGPVTPFQHDGGELTPTLHERLHTHAGVHGLSVQCRHLDAALLHTARHAHPDARAGAAGLGHHPPCAFPPTLARSVMRPLDSTRRCYLSFSVAVLQRAAVPCTGSS